MIYFEIEQTVILLSNIDNYLTTEFSSYPYDPEIDFYYFYVWSKEFPNIDIEHKFYEFHSWLKKRPRLKISCYRSLFRIWLEDNYPGAIKC